MNDQRHSLTDSQVGLLLLALVLAALGVSRIEWRRSLRCSPDLGAERECAAACEGIGLPVLEVMYDDDCGFHACVCGHLR